MNHFFYVENWLLIEKKLIPTNNFFLGYMVGWRHCMTKQKYGGWKLTVIPKCDCCKMRLAYICLSILYISVVLAFYWRWFYCIQLVKGSAWRSQRYLQKSQNLSGTPNAIVLYMYWRWTHNFRFWHFLTNKNLSIFVCEFCAFFWNSGWSHDEEEKIASKQNAFLPVLWQKCKFKKTY